MKRYHFQTNGKSKAESVIKGDKYRITVLTPSLVRLEYSETGDFEDRATQSVVNRDFSACEYNVTKNENGLVIETEALVLTYDEKPFSENGLNIKVKEIEGAVWHYGQKLNDLKGTYRTLDRVDGDIYITRGDHQEIKIELGTGIMSREGFSVIDDSASMALTDEGWVEPRKAGTDLYFFGYGHRFLEALSDFYHLCGKTPLLPRYALGNWWSRYYRYTEQEYMTLMNRFESEKLPFSVAVIDMDWHLVDDVDPKYGGGKRGWTGYTWNRKFFPDPKRFMKWLHDKNMKVTLNVHPADGVRDFEEIYPKMAKAVGIDPATEQAVEFDPSSPEFMKVYFDVLCHDLEKEGVDFWWIDWQQGTNSKMEGLDPLWILNHFHYLDSAWKGTRPMTFSRYAGVGSHRYPIGFSGDTTITWKSLAYQPYFTNTASNIGYGWWSHDIGGHMWGERDDEMMARWVQYGVFSPINRLHSSNNPFSGKEPWRYNDTTRNVMNKYLRLRHAMIPYLYTMNRLASRNDLPLIQPMYYAEPELEAAYNVPNEYYFGTELIVSPVTSQIDSVSKAAKVATWLPKGLWCDMFSGTVYEGGKMTDLWRTVDDIPVLMKAGAIVPMTDMSEYSNTVKNPDALDVLVFPAANGSFTLWEDEGDTPEDKDENWASTALAYENGTFTVGKASGNLSVIPEKRSWNVVFCSVEGSDVTVTVDGKAISVDTCYDEDLKRLTVKIPATEVTKQIAVSLAEVTVTDNRKQRIYDVLERAQMNYDQKHRIWNQICDAEIDSVAAVNEIEMDDAVRSCLLELI
ncbi:MAG: DUF4968 domain-containing protein [Clostridia bacterium]|nr:DUF4968 domain-containing protein [Clostridia bacterium]